jgi:hypothetical protein
LQTTCRPTPTLTGTCDGVRGKKTHNAPNGVRFATSDFALALRARFAYIGSDDERRARE